MCYITIMITKNFQTSLKHKQSLNTFPLFGIDFFIILATLAIGKNRSYQSKQNYTKLIEHNHSLVMKTKMGKVLPPPCKIKTNT